MIRVALLSFLVVTLDSALSVSPMHQQASEDAARCIGTDSGSVCDREPRRAGDTRPSPSAYCVQQTVQVLQQEPLPGTLAPGRAST
jgi:hypothetical protein